MPSGLIPICLAEMCEGLVFLTVGREEIDADRGIDPVRFHIVVFLYSDEQILLYQFAIEDLRSEKLCKEIARVVIHIGTSRWQIVCVNYLSDHTHTKAIRKWQPSKLICTRPPHHVQILKGASKQASKQICSFLCLGCDSYRSSADRICISNEYPALET
jgi:hypothetical protein